MWVGVYVDGFNLYHGAERLVGKDVKGWKWLDLRTLSEALVAQRSGWDSPHVERVVYCTARWRGSPESANRQDTYLRALEAADAVDHVEFGSFVNRVATAPLAVRRTTRTGKTRDTPSLVTADWPVMVATSVGDPVTDARFLVSVARREEKGSDVNVGAHLLLNLCRRQRVDAAVIISNDSDLELPVKEARQLILVGLVNPTRGYPAGALNGDPEEGPGCHWWYQLRPDDLFVAQLSDQVGKLRRPPSW